MKVLKDKCIGCGLCVKDCPCACIKLKESKADINNKNCINCGHCIAICPKNAVKSDELDMNEVKEYHKETFNLNTENLLNFIKFRRSVRNFTDKEVEVDKIEKIIEAGRFTQTATNSQDVRYIVLNTRENIEKLRGLVLKGLSDKGDYILNNIENPSEKYKKYARIWKLMYEQYKRNPDCKDTIFFNAPLVILVISKTPINGGLASTNMELISNTLGLGTFYSGFTVKASEDNSDINEFLSIENGESIQSCFVIGYPKVKYLRTVPRNKADISWI